MLSEALGLSLQWAWAFRLCLRARTWSRNDVSTGSMLASARRMALISAAYLRSDACSWRVLEVRDLALVICSVSERHSSNRSSDTSSMASMRLRVQVNVIAYNQDKALTTCIWKVIIASIVCLNPWPPYPLRQDLRRFLCDMYAAPDSRTNSPRAALPCA